MTAAFEPFFLDAGSSRAGQRFCIHHPPQGGPVRGAVVYIHPFAEEMNKSRRMAALQSRALAAQGYAVLQIDLLGCGDSSGDFGDASWEDWIEDVLLAVRWLRGQYDAPLWLWGLRVGCLLAVAAAERLQAPVSLLFWQPAIQGKVVLQQFLRLKAAAELADGGGKGVVQGLKQALSAGRSVEVAGYTLGPRLASGLEHAALRVPPRLQRAAWFEVSTRTDADLAPASAAVVSAWREASVELHAEVVTGPSFWQTTEIEQAEALLKATTAALQAGAHAPHSPPAGNSQAQTVSS